MSSDREKKIIIKRGVLSLPTGKIDSVIMQKNGILRIQPNKIWKSVKK